MRRKISRYEPGDLPITFIVRDLPGKGIGKDDLPQVLTGIFISCRSALFTF
jgi:hypothetical protein